MFLIYLKTLLMVVFAFTALAAEEKFCGDKQCQPDLGETELNCSDDCLRENQLKNIVDKMKCGNGICESDELLEQTCLKDCPQIAPDSDAKKNCGNGICESVEQQSGVCPIDCSPQNLSE